MQAKCLVHFLKKTNSRFAMLARLIILLFLFSLAVHCHQVNDAEEICQQLSIPAAVSELGVEGLYKEAIWQVYKFNLMNTDSFKVNDPFYADSIYSQTSLSEFKLKLFSVRKVEDTVSFNLYFEKGVYPVGHPYYGTVVFWGNDEKITIGDRVSFTIDRNVYESQFDEYLQENKDKLSPTLKCLITERQD